jgi:hypothetical protein
MISDAGSYARIGTGRKEQSRSRRLNREDAKEDKAKEEFAFESPVSSRLRVFAVSSVESSVGDAESGLKDQGVYESTV